MSDFTFNTMQRTFHAYGYTVNPNAESENHVVGDVSKWIQQGGKEEEQCGSHNMLLYSHPCALFPTTSPIPSCHPHSLLYILIHNTCAI